jgi:hypothetical protein
MSGIALIRRRRLQCAVQSILRRRSAKMGTVTTPALLTVVDLATAQKRAAEDQRAPRYALGFSTLDREISGIPLPLEGTLPSWLGGSLIRTGPAKFEVGHHSYQHWFDGLAMLHCFTIQTSGVTYSNRFLRSQSFCEAIETRRIVRGEFMTDPCRTLFGLQSPLGVFFLKGILSLLCFIFLASSTSSASNSCALTSTSLFSLLVITLHHSACLEKNGSY